MTPKPSVRLESSTLTTIFISWLVTSPELVDSYTVYWSGPSRERDNSTVRTRYTIGGLISNTPYNVTVEASGPAGKSISMTHQYFTSPKGDGDSPKYDL